MVGSTPRSPDYGPRAPPRSWSNATAPCSTSSPAATSCTPRLPTSPTSAPLALAVAVLTGDNHRTTATLAKDTPTLATADVGIAMGTDVSIGTVDIALMGEDLRYLPRTLDQTRRSRPVMLQNVGFSRTIAAALVPLAALGALGLATVVVIHEATWILVIGNARRGTRTPLQAGPSDTAVPPAREHHSSVAAAPEPDDPCCAPPPTGDHSTSHRARS